MKVKVILQSDIAGLGEEGDIKEVAGGYARNYLLPRHLVVPATKGNMNVLEQQRAHIAVKLEERRAAARSLAQRLDGISLDFPVRVGEQGRLYGSVTAQDIAARLEGDHELTIDRRSIELKEPLRALGTVDVPVRVAHAVTAHIKVVLRDQNAAAPRAGVEKAASASEPERVEPEADASAEADLTAPAG